jgi:hypothetical protein
MFIVCHIARGRLRTMQLECMRERASTDRRRILTRVGKARERSAAPPTRQPSNYAKNPSNCHGKGSSMALNNEPRSASEFHHRAALRLGSVLISGCACEISRFKRCSTSIDQPSGFYFPGARYVSRFYGVCCRSHFGSLSDSPFRISPLGAKINVAFSCPPKARLPV